MSASSVLEVDDEADEGTQSKTGSATGTVEDWFNAPEAKVFEEVRLRCKCIPGAARKEGNYVPQYGPLHRSHCVVRIFSHAEESDNAAGIRFLEFRLGETHGYELPCEPDDLQAPWSPPLESSRTEVAPWLTEAVLCLASSGSTAADFQAAGSQDDVKSGGGLTGCCLLTLLAALPTYDILADDGVVLRILEEGPGDAQKPRDLARVSASWRVWFQRNGELVVSTSSSERLEGEGVEFVLDEAKLAVSLEMALKDMRCGSRGILRVSEEWGQGSLMPGGTVVLRGAAIWVELILHRVENEMQPGEHASVEEALAFAFGKKEQGNASLKLDSKADVSRAVRRYEVGIGTLEALLPAATRTSSSSTSSASGAKAQKGPLADEAERPRVEELLAALRLNAAQAEIKRARWKCAAAFCDSVLRYDPVNLKGLYRRGLARAELEDFDGAVADFKHAAAASPADAGVRRELARVEAARRKQRASEKRSFGGIFDRMKQEDKTMKQRELAQEAQLSEEALPPPAAESAIDEPKPSMAEASAPSTAVPAPAATDVPAATSAPPVQAAPAAPVAEASPAAAVEETAATAAPTATTTAPEKKAEEADQSVDFLKDLGIPHTNQPQTNYLMPPSGVQRMTSEEPPPINYEVPSFLRKGKKKKAQ